MFSKYSGCFKHQTETSNFDPHCSECWDKVGDQVTDFERGIDHDYCPCCMDSMHGWLEDGECNACGWIQPS